MDTSEVYIKMCDCKEVRKAFWESIETEVEKKKEADVSLRNTKYCIRFPSTSTPDVIVFNGEGKADRSISLLSQDQIQGMLGFGKYPHVETQQFCQVICGGKCSYLQGSTSFEQLWLAFYMYEKHSKIWDGEKWRNK